MFQADDQLRRLLICLDPAASNEGLQFSEFQEKFTVWVESEQRLLLSYPSALTFCSLLFSQMKFIDLEFLIPPSTNPFTEGPHGNFKNVECTPIFQQDVNGDH